MPGEVQGILLQHNGRLLSLQPGRYLIGRSPACHLVLDDSIVSRQHALLEAFADGTVTICDLGSRNGVFAAGAYVGSDPVTLRAGDFFVIGTDIIELVGVREYPDISLQCDGPVPISEYGTVLRKSSTILPDETQTTRDFDRALVVAERFMATGHLDEAEWLLRRHLQEILAELQQNQPLCASARAKALSWALRLAEATNSPEWFDVALDLLIAQRLVCTREDAERFTRAAKRVRGHSWNKLANYLRVIRREAASDAIISQLNEVLALNES